VRAVLLLASVAVAVVVIAGCGGDESTLESLAGTPASVHIVNDVETMAHACAKETKKAREAGVKAYTNLAKITAIHPNSTFGPEENAELTMRQLLRRTVEKTGHCIGVSVDSSGQFHAD
jgi:hypothetical protein